MIKLNFYSCHRNQNAKSETRNPKWFDLLTTLSEVEGQYRMTKIQMTKMRLVSLQFFDFVLNIRTFEF
jgi:hypothetical protein